MKGVYFMKLSKINLIRIITISVSAVALTTCVVVGIAKNKTVHCCFYISCKDMKKELYLF